MTVRLYVGNLPLEVDREAFELLFSQAGEVLSAKVIRDRKTNKCRGFGFVTVSTQEIADSLISQLNGSDFGGQPMKLEVAQPREKDKEEGETAELGSESTPDKAEEGQVVDSEDKPKPSAKKRDKGGSRDKRERETSGSGGSAEPDPRWASQLQRIKEQLLAASQPQ
ncbi:MAG: RNA-binding protein [Synechococcales cyanobacterium]